MGRTPTPKPGSRGVKTARSRKSKRSKRSQQSQNRGPLEEQQYYHGLLPRDDILELLKKKGDFLVRYSEVNDQKKYILSVFWDQQRHFIIEHSTAGKYYLGGEAEQYDSIPDLIATYVNKQKEVNRKTGARLIQPAAHSHWELQHSQIVKEEKLGEGAFGEVYRGTIRLDAGNTKPVAIKLSRAGGMSKADIVEMMKETRIMRQYNHPNVVRLFGVAAEQEPIMIVMELVTGGGLDTYVNKHSAMLQPIHLTKFVLDAASGLAYLHDNKCIHRDVAARNCLIANDGTVKISDFGLSKSGQNTYKMSTKKKVPIKWLALETLNSAVYTPKTDVWSFGIMMWETFSEGSDPYPGMTAADVLRGVKEGYRMEAPEKMPQPIRDIMYRCWLEMADQRPDFKQIVNMITQNASYASLPAPF